MSHCHLSPNNQTQGHQASTPSLPQAPSSSSNVPVSNGGQNTAEVKFCEVCTTASIGSTNVSAGYRYRVNQIKRVAAMSRNLSPESQDQLTWFIDVKLLDLRTPSRHNMDDARLMNELEDLSGIKDSLIKGGARSELIDRIIDEKFNALVSTNI
ncbi:MAG: hypothetical protein Q9211_003797 [Gyalolechia sp. 1 TL-2023]